MQKALPQNQETVGNYRENGVLAKKNPDFHGSYMDL
jgi:hypothetical protein